MDQLARFVRGFGRFWYDFIVGDDPKIATAVAAVLALGGVLVGLADMSGEHLVLGLAALLMMAFAAAMAADVSTSRRRHG